MTSPLEELARRVARLEAEVGRESGLRAAVDRDVADHGAAIRATHHLVQALAITQSAHTSVLERHTESLARIEAGLADIVALLSRLVDEG